MPATTISAIRATPVTVPLEAPIRHSNGAHWGRFVRTIVEVETDNGLIGLGEMGGGGANSLRAQPIGSNASRVNANHPWRYVTEKTRR